MNPEIKKFYNAEPTEAGEMTIASMHRALAKMIRPDLTASGQTELAIELNAAKEAADRGDRTKLESLYKRMTGPKGSSIDKYV